jgi:hypothetical protein
MLNGSSSFDHPLARYLSSVAAAGLWSACSSVVKLVTKRPLLERERFRSVVGQ